MDRVLHEHTHAHTMAKMLHSVCARLLVYNFERNGNNSTAFMYVYVCASHPFLVVFSIQFEGIEPRGGNKQSVRTHLTHFVFVFFRQICLAI